MLARTASNFYWMGRCIERASCLSQLLIIQMTEIPEDSFDFISAGWEGIFDRFNIAGFKKDFLPDKVNEGKTSDDFLLADAYTFVDFLTFETHHAGSILSCLSFARENARQCQEKISKLIWPQINKTYLRTKNMQLIEFWPHKIVGFYKDILNFSCLFYGITRDSLYQNESAHFIQTGRFLERFQNTTSVFENYIRLMINRKEEEEDITGLLLRCGAFDSYRQLYSLDLTFRNTIDFLLYSSYFSGSLKFCTNEIKKALSSIEKREEKTTPIFQSLERIEKQLEKGHSDQPITDFLNALYQESVWTGEIIDKTYFNQLVRP